MPAAGRLYRYGQASAPGLGRTGELCAQSTKAGAEKGVRTAVYRIQASRQPATRLFPAYDYARKRRARHVARTRRGGRGGSIAHRRRAYGQGQHRLRDRAAAPVAGQLSERGRNAHAPQDGRPRAASADQYPGRAVQPRAGSQLLAVRPIRADLQARCGCRAACFRAFRQASLSGGRAAGFHRRRP